MMKHLIRLLVEKGGVIMSNVGETLNVIKCPVIKAFVM